MSKTSALLRRKSRSGPRDIMEIAMSGDKHPVDHKQGVIRNVKILGDRSRNGGVYSTKAMAAAKPLYEGARVNIDHPDRSTPDQERTFGDWFGVLKNVRLAKDGLYGDLSYLKSHPLAGQVCEAAERFPASFGLSHNAQVTEAVREGQTVYEAIHRVRSVDIVCKPATTRGIFEAEAPAMKSAVEGDGAVGDMGENRALGAADAAPIGSSEQGAGGATNDRDAFLEQMGTIYDSQDDATIRLHAGIEVLFAVIAGDATSPDDPADASAAPVEEASQTDRADRGQAAAVGVESARQEGGAARAAARIVLEAVGLRPDTARIAKLATLSNATTRRTVLASWLQGDASERQITPRETPAHATLRPLCHGGPALEAALTTLDERRTSDWDDPQTATLRLLGH